MKRTALLLFAAFGCNALIAQITNPVSIFYLNIAPTGEPTAVLQNSSGGVNTSGLNKVTGTQPTIETNSSNTVMPVKIPNPAESNNPSVIDMPAGIPNAAGNNTQGTNNGVQNTQSIQNTPPKKP